MEKACAQPLPAEFSPASETGSGFASRARVNPSPGTRQPVARPLEPAPSKIADCYHSPVCSTPGDEIDRIAAAIDQLASDIRDDSGASERELTARVADLWRMVSDVDPELARRARRYTGPADDAPQA